MGERVSATTQVDTIASAHVDTDLTKPAVAAWILTSAAADFEAAPEVARTCPDLTGACADAECAPTCTDADVRTSTSASETRAVWDRCARTPSDHSNVVAQAVCKRLAAAEAAVTSTSAHSDVEVVTSVARISTVDSLALAQWDRSVPEMAIVSEVSSDSNSKCPASEVEEATVEATECHHRPTTDTHHRPTPCASSACQAATQSVDRDDLLRRQPQTQPPTQPPRDDSLKSVTNKSSPT